MISWIWTLLTMSVLGPLVGEQLPMVSWIRALLMMHLFSAPQRVSGFHGELDWTLLTTHVLGSPGSE